MNNEGELKERGLTLETARQQAEDQQQWRTITEAPCATRHSGSWRRNKIKIIDVRHLFKTVFLLSVVTIKGTFFCVIRWLTLIIDLKSSAKSKFYCRFASRDFQPSSCVMKWCKLWQSSQTTAIVTLRNSTSPLLTQNSSLLDEYQHQQAKLLVKGQEMMLNVTQE